MAGQELKPPVSGMGGPGQEQPLLGQRPSAFLLCLLPLGRKGFEQIDGLLMLAVETRFPSSAEKWTMQDLQKDLSHSLKLQCLLSTGCLYFLFHVRACL